ncbi:MEIOTIC F-BOX protein MOF-like isoform X2 [Miscanthus floridulus]|uniref:MEIOTIC F-BOX protein MOF-like isoform X2 n=1 Tax=Miscanthus floridulus TaxID=154761 RepID=UPI003459F791
MEVEEAERARASGDGGGGGRCSAAGPDRLSSLPDCLLHTIMSFMKARQAVQTCVLSTRWRNLWRSVPCLDIDLAEFKTVPVSDNNSGSSGDDNSGSGGDDNSGSGGDDNSGSGGDDNSDSDGESSESSESDLDSSDSNDGDVPDSDGNSSESDTVSSDSSDITTSSEDDSSDSDTYIYGANINSYENNKVKHKEWEDFEDFTVNLMRQCNIAQLDSFRLHIVGSRAPKFGNRQAAGWLRRAMKYCTPDRPRQHGGVSSGSWHLKSLHLCHVLLDNGFMKRVNSVCRSLEDLELDDCSCQIESVTSQSLKTMVLKNCRWRNLSVIASPTLKTLVIDGGSNTDDSGLVILAPAVSYLNLAVKADQFCGGVSINEVLGKEPRFQKFKNLRNLMLNKCNLSDDFHILVFFLQSSPILEKLTLRCCKFPKHSSKKKGTPILNKTASELRGLDLLCENLKVEIIYKYGYGLHLVQLLMRISVNLLENNIKLTKVN